MKTTWLVAVEPDEGAPLEALSTNDLAELLGAILAELKLRDVADADLLEHMNEGAGQ